MYQTVYMLPDWPPYWWLPACGTIGVILGIFFLHNAQRKRPGYVRFKVVGWYLLVISVIWTILLGVLITGEWQVVHGAYVHNAYQVVEGRVESFVPMPKTGKGTETFTVNGVPFVLSDFDWTAGFSTTTFRRGPMRGGLLVRVAYVPYKDRNVIVRLDVAPTP